MECMIGRGCCRVKRELDYWRRMAYWGLSMAVLNFTVAWAVAFCRVAGVMK